MTLLFSLQVIITILSHNIITFPINTTHNNNVIITLPHDYNFMSTHTHQLMDFYMYDSFDVGKKLTRAFTGFYKGD